MLHKPAGYISATEDKKLDTVLELLPENARSDLFPVGRLDRDTEGLLLLTNDGKLAHYLLPPNASGQDLLRQNSGSGEIGTCAGLSGGTGYRR